MSAPILVVVEHDRGDLMPATLEAMTIARDLALAYDAPVEALAVGDVAAGTVDRLAEFGAGAVHLVTDDLLTDYGPEIWADCVTQVVRSLAPSIVIATGTDRGNEVMAGVAARLDAPFAANCIEVRPTEGGVDLTRVRWGGSLLEHARLDAEIPLVTIAHHSIEPVPAPTPTAVVTSPLPIEIDQALTRSMVTGRVERTAGVTLATAPVVVGGGRGVGSADGFGPLEALASTLGGVVGCSRAVTNNGWRNHTDQVGQTGTRIAPDVYFACGISGAIQHWVGAMASKHIIAINTDSDANMVHKAGYAVIGDLHVVVPAITEEILRRRG
jgi:electron transfer flavoprotein alpha subunit